MHSRLTLHPSKIALVVLLEEKKSWDSFKKTILNEFIQAYFCNYQEQVNRSLSDVGQQTYHSHLFAVGSQNQSLVFLSTTVIQEILLDTLDIKRIIKKKTNKIFFVFII